MSRSQEPPGGAPQRTVVPMPSWLERWKLRTQSGTTAARYLFEPLASTSVDSPRKV